MCLAIPYKVTNVSRSKIEVELFNQKRTVKKSIVKIIPGDFVLIQNNVIIKKISQKSAEEILKLFLQK